MSQISPFSFPPAFIGVGYGVPVPGETVIAVDPNREYVAGGFGFLTPGIPQVLPWMTDDLTRDFGPAVYDVMDTEPMCGSTFRLFRMQVLANELQIQPALQPKEEVRDDPERTGWTADETLAQEITEYCIRSTSRCTTPIKSVMNEMLDSARIGNKLAEIVMEPGEGLDAGAAVLKDLKARPRWAWLFVADVFMNVIGILAFDPMLGGFVIIPRSKFWLASWQIQDNDPRGKSLYRPGYRFWNMKQLLIPDYHQYLHQHSQPKRVGKTSERNSGQPYPNVGKDGQTLNPPTITAEEAMTRELAELDGSAAITIPFGAELTFEWPQGEGQAWINGFEWMDRQMVYSILGSAREALEAEHGSKADSDSAHDKVGNAIRTARGFVEQGYRSNVLHRLIELHPKYGKEIADRLTPKVSLGETEHQDVAKLMTAVAALVRAGGVDMPSQGAGIAVMLSLPKPAEGAFDVPDVPEDDDQGGDTDGDKPTPKPKPKKKGPPK